MNSLQKIALGLGAWVIISIVFYAMMPFGFPIGSQSSAQETAIKDKRERAHDIIAVVGVIAAACFLLGVTISYAKRALAPKPSAQNLHVDTSPIASSDQFGGPPEPRH